MRQVEESQKISREENDRELVQTASLREALCEPCGYSLLDSIGNDITRHISGLSDPFCVGYQGSSMESTASAFSFFE